MNELLTLLLDAEGKVKRWPKKAAERTAVLEYFGEKFEKGKDYTEVEVNGIIGSLHTFSDNSGLSGGDSIPFLRLPVSIKKSCFQ
jgi:hypothetical protein